MISSTPTAALWCLTAVVTLAGASACGGSAFSNDDDTASSGSSITSNGSGGTSNSGSGGTRSGGTSAGGTSNSGSGGTNSGGTSAGGTTTSASATGAGGATATGATSVTNGSGGSAGSASASTSSGGSSGSGGGPGAVCLQPITPGPCEAYIPAYGYNADTGLCESFVYGGCDGNDNRFETLEACLDTCDPGGLTACESDMDCVIDMGCCGIGGEASLDTLKVVHRAYDSSRAPECALVDCAFREPSGLEHFGTRCNTGQCEVYDVRESELSACQSDEDCRLRNGLGCCGSCLPDDWVAVSVDEEKLVEQLCGDELVACPACVAIPPEDLGAACNDSGHCAVVSTL